MVAPRNDRGKIQNPIRLWSIPTWGWKIHHLVGDFRHGKDDQLGLVCYTAYFIDVDIKKSSVIHH